MDCLFLMAEALEKKAEFIKACELYKTLCLLEYKKPYFHHFMEEVIDRLRVDHLLQDDRHAWLPRCPSSTSRT